MHLSHSEAYSLANHLRAAAEQYLADAQTTAAQPRIAEQFQRQRAECLLWATHLEECGSGALSLPNATAARIRAQKAEG